MTLLSIVQNAADMVGIAQPSAIIGNNDKTARQMLALLNRGGATLARVKNAFGGCWQILEQVHDFTTTASEDEYALPADFGSIIADAIWDRSNFWDVRGQASPQLWQQLRSGLAQTSQLRKIYRIRRVLGGATGVRKFTIDPEPSAADNVVFEYVSTYWVSNAAGDTFKASFTVDTDTGLLDEDLLEMDLIWRFKAAKGLDYTVDLAEFEQERDRRLAAEVATTVSMGRRQFRLPPVNTPWTDFGS